MKESLQKDLRVKSIIYDYGIIHCAPQMTFMLMKNAKAEIFNVMFDRWFMLTGICNSAGTLTVKSTAAVVMRDHEQPNNRV